MNGPPPSSSRSRSLSLLALLSLALSLSLSPLLDICYVCAAVSGDELRVPYVPYVVVDKNKDEFDYDRLQDEILGYLNRRHSEASTTLYDFLRTSVSSPATPPTADLRGASLPSSFAGSSASSYYTVGYPASAARPAHSVRGAAAYPADSVRSVGSSYSVDSVHPPTSPAYPLYPASIYKAATKENPLVTARVKVTTYQPHKYSTPFDNYSPRGYALDLPARSEPSARQPPFVRVKDHAFAAITATTTTTDSSLYTTAAINDNVGARFPYASEMKCSLKSSRYVYDGDCASRKPVVETVCADRCIRYEYKRSKKPYSSEDSKTNSLHAGETKKQVVALSCSDGDVKKQKVKLYCKDGTVINNIIRIVRNCVCNEHSEKVHATKRNQRASSEAEAKMMYSVPHPRVRSRPKFQNNGGGGY